MAVPEVVLWNAGDVLGDGDGTAEFDDSSYVTEVVLRASRPRAQARLVAMRNGDGGSAQIVGFGVVSGTQRVATGKDRLRIEPLVRIEPLPIAAVQAHLEAGQVGTDVDLFTPPPLRPRALSPKRGESLLAALEALSPPVADLLRKLREAHEPVAGARGQRVREERDAIGLALDLARMEMGSEDLNGNVPRSGAEQPLEGLLAPEAIYDIEDDLIAEDLRRFDRNGSLVLTHASAARFTDQDFVLTIINVNRKGLERVAGVDLVYWDIPGDSYTMVQYKRLTRRDGGEPGGERWAYTDRAELAKSIERMEQRPGRMADSSQFRLTSSPYWFKFLRADSFTQGDPVVLPGMYVPAEYMRRALEDGSCLTGRRGGFEVTYANVRYLARGTFVDLVRKTMIGTTAQQTAAVLDAVNALALERQAILAVRIRRT